MPNKLEVLRKVHQILASHCDDPAEHVERMKTINKAIIFEAVSNGWIVRPFNPGNWSCAEAPAISVFTDMAAMQAALPSFFETPDPYLSEAQRIHDAVKSMNA
jgi:hypothetical protein